MDCKNLDREVEEWLDRASAAYGMAEPQLGYETRVIAKVAGRLATRRLLLRWFSLAIAASAVVVFSCYFLLTRIENHPEIDTAVQRKLQPNLSSPVKQQQQPSAIQAVSSGKQDVGKRVHPSAARVSGNRFLSAKLSDEERYLISFAQKMSVYLPTGSPEAELESLQISIPEIQTIEIPKAQISLVKIEIVQVPTTLQSGDPL